MEMEGTEVGAETLVCLEILGLQDRGEETIYKMEETMVYLVYLVYLVHLVINLIHIKRVIIILYYKLKHDDNCSNDDSIWDI